MKPSEVLGQWNYVIWYYNGQYLDTADLLKPRGLLQEEWISKWQSGFSLLEWEFIGNSVKADRMIHVVEN